MSVPRHLSLIPDGIRRWAAARGEPASAGHRAGIAAVGRCVAAAWDAGVETVSFWWGSPANLTERDPAEVAAIVEALGAWLTGEGAALLAAHDATFEVIGRWQDLTPGLAGPLACAAAAGSGPRRLVLLMAYDGREEILAAARAAPDPDQLADHLWTAHLPPVDLVLRTGGEPHLSAGYLLWHIAEAVLHFSDRLWPDYDADALAEALAAYGQGHRRYGR